MNAVQLPEPLKPEDLSPGAVRALKILETTAGIPPGLTLTEIAQRLSLPKSTAHVLLRTLSAFGFLERDVTGRFRVGLRAFEVGASYLKNLDLVDEFHQVAGRIVDRCGETVQLAVLDGLEVVYISKRDGTQPVRIASNIGSRLPATTTSLGKALLASLPDLRRTELLQHACLAALTGRSITVLPEFLADLTEVFARGYARDLEETAEGLQCVGAPIFNSAGEPVAAISIAFPATRASHDRVVELGLLVSRGAAELSDRLGAPGASWRYPAEDST